MLFFWEGVDILKELKFFPYEVTTQAFLKIFHHDVNIQKNAVKILLLKLDSQPWKTCGRNSQNIQRLRHQYCFKMI